jgi:hypothetical protein
VERVERFQGRAYILARKLSKKTFSFVPAAFLGGVPVEPAVELPTSRLQKYRDDPAMFSFRLESEADADELHVGQEVQLTTSRS